jgi:putative ABC transport system ATP-binding protein
MIQLDDIVKTYNTNEAPVYALRDVNLHISEGEFAAIMGPSGSGKSTLLSIIGAMNAPSQGRMIFDGIDVYSLSTERRADFRHEYLGFMFQQLQLLPYLTALENVLLGLVIAKKHRNDKVQRARQVLEEVGLGGKENRLPSQLSGGEQGRVAVARALVNEPPLLLADEPTGNLDSANSRQILQLLQELHETGRTVIMVTHDKEAAGYADRVIHILDGRIAEGPNGQGASPHDASYQLDAESSR